MSFGTPEFAVSMAAMILYDGEAEITSDNIATLLDATNNTVAPYWPSLFASFLKDGKAEELIFTGGNAGGAAPAAAAGAAAAAPAEEVKAAKPKEEEVDPMEGGMDMFGGGGSDH